MAYTPELSYDYSSALRRISWAFGKPMTKTLEALLNAIVHIVDKKKICEKCKDAKCHKGHYCIFKEAQKLCTVDISTIKKEDVKVKVKEVAIMASKKLGKNFNSCALSYTATAEVEEDEEFLDVIQNIKNQLVNKLNQALLPPKTAN